MEVHLYSGATGITRIHNKKLSSVDSFEAKNQQKISFDLLVFVSLHR